MIPFQVSIDMIPRIFCRTLCAQRRAYCAGDGAKTPLDAVRQRDTVRYGGLNSLEILTSEHHAHDVRDMTQKPLWHVWQLATASAVPLGLWIYLKQVEAVERGAVGKERNGTEDVVRDEGMTASPAQLATSLADLEQRLARIEQRLQARGIDR